jgi:hypothetical protein
VQVPVWTLPLGAQVEGSVVVPAGVTHVTNFSVTLHSFSSGVVAVTLQRFSFRPDAAFSPVVLSAFSGPVSLTADQAHVVSANKMPTELSVVPGTVLWIGIDNGDGTDASATFDVVGATVQFN